MKKKIYIISGEASGDLHAANLVHELNKISSDLDFRAWGGIRLRNEGVNIEKDIRDIAFMGFIEVLLNIRIIFKNLKQCKKNLLDFKPDILILVDYPGFNLRIAKWAKKQGITIFYYISPQIWAWKQSRIHTIKNTITRMYCILPFEKDFYAKFNMPVSYLGHPLLDEVKRFKDSNCDSNFGEKIIAILPGSRKQEIERKLPIMLAASAKFPEYTSIVACAPNLDITFYDKYRADNVIFIENNTYSLLQKADVAIVTSGTATLETALFKVPQVVCYKTSRISYLIAKQLIKIKYISLVNLILDKEAIVELIQDDCSTHNIVRELEKLLLNKIENNRVKSCYNDLIYLLKDDGASKRIAEDMLKNIKFEGK